MTAGCGNMDETLGIERKAPDEFSVVRRAPLSLPPNYSLRPPNPGERRPQEKTLRDEARGSLTGQAASADTASIRNTLVTSGATGAGPTTDRTAGETALLKQAGAGDANPNIRLLVNRESAVLAADDSGLVERLMFWREEPPPGHIVDAKRETRRIQNNAALGNPVTTGETPTIERKTHLKGINIF
jgi:hypothetical protein